MTNLFLVNTSVTSTITGGAEPTRLLLTGGAGGASTLRNKNSVAAPAAALKITDSTASGVDGNAVAWYSTPVTAVTIAGQIVASLWCRENATNANVAASIGVYRCNASGVELSTIVDPSINQGGLEMATTAGGASKIITVTAANVVDTVFVTGDRLKVALFIDNAVDQGGSGSMGAGNVINFWMNGPTGSAGQSQIAFTETISGIVPGSLARPPLTINRSAIRRSYIW